MSSLRKTLEDRLAGIADLAVFPSQFGGDDAYWVEGKEILHFHENDVLDLRLTRAKIRERRAALRADPRVELRASTSSDWLEIHFASRDDVDFVVELVAVAAAAYRGARG